jgi:hypothetical protein
MDVGDSIEMRFGQLKRCLIIYEGTERPIYIRYRVKLLYIWLHVSIAKYLPLTEVHDSASSEIFDIPLIPGHPGSYQVDTPFMYAAIHSDPGPVLEDWKGVSLFCFVILRGAMIILKRYYLQCGCSRTDGGSLSDPFRR